MYVLCVCVCVCVCRKEEGDEYVQERTWCRDGGNSGEADERE